MRTKILLILNCSMTMLSLTLIFFYAPEEKTQGLVQKLFYFHVSAAWAMYAAFMTAGITALLYLVRRKNFWDFLSHSSVEVGLVFCTMVLVSGPIWAKPIWGAWWTWDPRLTTTFLIWLIFLSYLMLRQFFNNEERGRVYGAVLTLFGILDIPLIFFAVKLWRGVHPSVLGQESNMPRTMKITLIITNIALLILATTLITLKTRMRALETRLQLLRKGP